MGRLSYIEDLASSGLMQHTNLKLIVRGRPRYLDPQMIGGNLRFGFSRGFNFTALLPDNQVYLAQDAYKDSNTLTLKSRPSAMTIDTLIRIGQNENVGELHIVSDLIDSTGIEISEPLLENYTADITQDPIPSVSLIGTPSFVYMGLSSQTIMLIESWYPIVPNDNLWLSGTPLVLTSLQLYQVKRANFLGTRAGVTSIEPSIIYRYEIELNTQTGRLPFVPENGLPLYLNCQPLYFRGGYGVGDLTLPADVGPCLVDAFYGNMLESYTAETHLGFMTFDSFGNQLNYSDQLWEQIPSNYLILERTISSDSLLFWQRITGNFQYQKKGYFLAELDDEGKYTMSSDLLVPKWPVEKERGWVIPLFSRSKFRCVIQFEPQEQQVFEIPSNTLTFIRPKIQIGDSSIQRILISFSGYPDSRVEIRDWEFDGSMIKSLSYYMLGGPEAYGDKRWMAGGFCVKPLFYNLNVLKAHYSDGVSRYNNGYMYS